MNILALRICAAGVLTAALASATPILTLLPADISGTPGIAAGWSFNLQADQYFTEIVSAFPLNETNPQLGSFTDFISLQGGPLNGVLPALFSWHGTYDPAQGTGFGEYAIPSTASIGDSDIGQFLVEYQSFSADPNDPVACFNGCFVQAGTLMVDFQVTVAPEPGGLFLCSLGLLLCALIKFPRRRLGDRLARQ